MVDFSISKIMKEQPGMFGAGSANLSRRIIDNDYP
jgi:hypothetical protein